MNLCYLNVSAAHSRGIKYTFRSENLRTDMSINNFEYFKSTLSSTKGFDDQDS